MTVSEDATTTCFQMKGASFTLPTLRLHSLDYAKLSVALDEKIQQAPNFFKQAPIVLDLQPVSQFQDFIDLHQIAATIKKKGLILVGIRGANAAIQHAAREAGLAILPESKNERSTPEVTTAKKVSPEISESAQPEAKITSTKLITQPVRSGQQIYAPGGDLVVLAQVSHGAELLADGNIHVYAPLRGRALAGINGDKNAIIYCQSLEAELISVAGQYRISEDYKDSMWKMQALIQLKDDRLQISQI
jgi:septum site-determining protein MinC